MMELEVMGTVLSVKRQWWFKVNTKAFRTGPTDGAIFPHVVKVSYTVDGTEYVKRKWFSPGLSVPLVGERVRLLCRADKPQKSRIV